MGKKEKKKKSKRSDVLVKEYCDYCGFELPERGFCINCWYQKKNSEYDICKIPTPDPIIEAMKIDDSEKVPCRYCGVPILPRTAKKTGGFCMPHRYCSGRFLDTIGGEPIFSEPVTQLEVVEKARNLETNIGINVLFSFMKFNDELRLFTVREPFERVDRMADLGVGLFRDGICISGFVVKWKNNPHYFQDSEVEITRDEFAELYGDNWEEFSKLVPGRSIFVRFRTSQKSWDYKYGRAGYGIKLNGEYIYQFVNEMN